MVQPDGESPQHPTPRTGRYRLGVVLAVGVVGLFAGWVLASSPGVSTAPTEISDDEPPPLTPTSPIPVGTTTTTSMPPSDATVPRVGDAPPRRGRVEVLPGATDLLGFVALAVGVVAEEGGNLWVLQPEGRLVQRVDVPLRVAGYEYPVLIVGDYVLFTSPDGAYRLDLDLTTPAEKIAEESFLVPGSGTDRAWVVGCCEPSWFAAFDGESGELGARTEIEPGFGWPQAGYGNGLLFHPNDRETYGPIAYWPAGGEPEPLQLEMDTQTGLGAVTGDLAVLISPGPVLRVVDLITGEQISTVSFETEDGNATRVCFSPDGTYVAAVTSTGPVEVWETASGATVGRMTPSQHLWNAGWAAPGQFVFITDTARHVWLRVFDAETLEATNIARVATQGLWRVATTGPTC